MPEQAKHLSLWDFFCFLERDREGHIDNLLESHLVHCQECLKTLDVGPYSDGRYTPFAGGGSFS